MHMTHGVISCRYWGASSNGTKSNAKPESVGSGAIRQGAQFFEIPRTCELLDFQKKLSICQSLKGHVIAALIILMKH